jgi:hypothetical protein
MYRIAVNVEQGYDRFDARDPRRDVSGRSYAWSGYVLFGMRRGPFVSVELGPFGSVGFGTPGDGAIKGVAVAGGYAFQFPFHSR